MNEKAFLSSLSSTMDSENTRNLLADAARRAADYLDGLDGRSVAAIPGASARLTDALAGPLPDGPSKAADIVAFLDEHGSPATVASAGGRYFGFVTGGALPVSLAANYIAGAWDQNAFSAISSPAIAALEDAALRWVKEALGLPASAEGTIVTGATMANFTCLAAARNWALHKAGWNVDAQGLFAAPEITVVVGAEAHATLFKVLSLLGLGRERVVRVPVDAQGRMRADSLPDIEGPNHCLHPSGQREFRCVRSGDTNHQVGACRRRLGACGRSLRPLGLGLAGPCAPRRRGWRRRLLGDGRAQVAQRAL